MNEFPSRSTLQIEAQRWSVSVDFLRRKVRSGELPHWRVGNRIRVRPEDVESLLSSRRPSGPKAATR
jgi:excisionase family DNA binding protein